MNKQKIKYAFLFLFILTALLLLNSIYTSPTQQNRRDPASNTNTQTFSFFENKAYQHNLKNTEDHQKNRIEFSLKNIIQNEKNNIYQFNEDSLTQEKRLKSLAKAQTKNELIELKNIVTDSQEDSDSRYIALHFLILRNVEAHELLCEIFFTPNELLETDFGAHDARSTLKDVETNVRFLALEQIEKNLILNNNLDFNTNALTTHNPYLKSLAKIVNLSRASSEPLLTKLTSQFNPQQQAPQ